VRRKAGRCVKTDKVAICCFPAVGGHDGSYNINPPKLARFESGENEQLNQTVTMKDTLGVVQNLFRVGRHLLRSTNHRLLRSRSFAVWQTVTAA
jgi:hypothetical protein